MTKSTVRSSNTENIRLGSDTVSIRSNSLSRSNSREVNTLLLSSTIRIVPLCIYSFLRGEGIDFTAIRQINVQLLDTLGTLLYPHVTHRRDYPFCKALAMLLQSSCSATAKPLQHYCKAYTALLQSHCSVTAKYLQHLCSALIL